MNTSYRNFFLMVGTSAVLMHAVMYMNTYSFDHIFFSEMRLYMTMLMATTMAVVMLGFMRHMYTDKKINTYIMGGSILLFALSLYLVRSQALVDQVDYMEAMIPHHSIAILTSERANITDPRVRELADEIIEAQRREIAEMKELIAELK